MMPPSHTHRMEERWPIRSQRTTRSAPNSCGHSRIGVPRTVMHNSQPWQWVFDAGTLHLLPTTPELVVTRTAPGGMILAAAPSSITSGGRRRRWVVGHRRQVSNPHDHDNLASATFHRRSPWAARTSAGRRSHGGNRSVGVRGAPAVARARTAAAVLHRTGRALSLSIAARGDQDDVLRRTDAVGGPVTSHARPRTSRPPPRHALSAIPAGCRRRRCQQERRCLNVHPWMGPPAFAYISRPWWCSPWRAGHRRPAWRAGWHAAADACWIAAPRSRFARGASVLRRCGAASQCGPTIAVRIAGGTLLWRVPGRSLIAVMLAGGRAHGGGRRATSLTRPRAGAAQHAPRFGYAGSARGDRIPPLTEVA
jgi:hypothetical protein